MVTTWRKAGSGDSSGKVTRFPFTRNSIVQFLRPSVAHDATFTVSLKGAVSVPLVTVCDVRANVTERSQVHMPETTCAVTAPHTSCSLSSNARPTPVPELPDVRTPA